LEQIAMSVERALLLEALNATEELHERVEDTAGAASDATSLAEAAQGEVDEVRRAVAERWVVDHLDDATVWLKPSVLDAASEVSRRAHEDGLEEIEYFAAKGGPPITKEELAQHEQDCARLHRDFLGHVVRRTATAAVASKGFKIFEDHWLVVEVSDLTWSDGNEFPGFTWATSYARR
jgi:hypothetical protein